MRRVTTSIIHLNKYRKRWAEHVGLVLIQEHELYTKFCLQIFLGNLEADEGIVLKWIVQK
jgi:hypothetical protein